jgi:glycerophosphoryl diester phosphodiesterase
VSGKGFAQTRTQSAMYLTNYTITKDSREVATVKSKSGVIKSISLNGEHHGAFLIEGLQIFFKANKLKSDAKWFDITITAKTETGKETKTFRIVRDNFIRNKVIAHRGAWKNTGAPENSIAALQHAIRLGCEGSEFDVHMTADSIPVVNHDPSIQGTSIAKANSADVLSIKLTNNETFPTLENYLKAGMEQNKTKLILEIKPSELGKESSVALARKVVILVEKLKAQAWVDYISFDYDVCTEVIKIAPYTRVSYLNGDKTPAELAADNFFGLDYNQKFIKKNPGWIQEAKDKRITINVWTVNDKVVMQELLQKDVDFITTNEPELLLTLVK